jgi:hypothetical protein
MTSHSSHEHLLVELSRAVRRDHLARRRRMRIASAVLAVVAVSAATVAAATQAPWWQGAAPPVNPEVVNRQLAPTVGSSFPPTADRSRARTVAEWQGATLVAAPVGDKGGYCLIPALPGSPDIGFSCEYQADDEVRAYARPGSDPRWIIWGRFVEPEAATIDLTPAIGAAVKVTLQPGGFFIADLPQSRWPALDNAAGSGAVLDSSGRTLQRICLNFGPSPESSQAGTHDTPSPLTTSEACEAPPLIAMVPQLDKAQKLVETTLRYGTGITPAGTRVAVYQAPDTGSTATCVFVAPVPLPTDRLPGGMVCGEKAGQPSQAHPLNASSSSSLTQSTYDHLVSGVIDPSLQAVRVEAQVAGKTLPLAFANDHFLGELPPTDSVDVRDAFVVAYDAAGKEVARQQLGMNPR